MLSASNFVFPTETSGNIKRQKVTGDNYSNIFYHYQIALIELCLSLFQWENLPPTMNSRFLEITLHSRGLGTIIYDEETKSFLNTLCNIDGGLNFYNEGVNYRCYSANGKYSRIISRENLILVRNNILEKPTYTSLIMFAKRLTDIQMTIEQNLYNQRKPFLILCEETQRLTLQNIYSKFDRFEPVIFGDKTLNTDGIKVLSTGADYNADKMTDLKNSVWKEVLTFLGIDNATDKKERVITDEINSNNECNSRFCNAMLQTRKEACREFNKKYGMNIDVRTKTYEEIKENAIIEVEE